MKKAVIAIFVIGVVSFTIGLYVGDNYGNGRVLSQKINPKEKGDYKDTFSDGWKAAKEKLEKSGFLMGMNMGEVKSLAGDVKSVSGQKIVMNTALLNPLDDEDLMMRTINLTNDTKITVYKTKTQKEQESFRKNADSRLGNLRFQRSNLEKKIASCQPIDPMMIGEADDSSKDCMDVNNEYSELNTEIMELEMGIMDTHKKIENAKLSDIKKGYSIVIISNETVSDKKEITAVKIEAREATLPAIMPTIETGDPMPPVPPTE